MSKQALNCLYAFALVDKKGREAVAEVVKAELLTRLKQDAGLNRGWANFILCHRACAQERSTLHRCRRENPVVRLGIERINNGQETTYRSLRTV
ncbi:MAG TPA: hypothetical protein VK514_03705 [Candidatus Acidoferrum sp.]|nr:hypothetical protein [Candidatus Acidoferrum sp.]